MKTIKIIKEDVDLFAPYSGICINGEQAEEYGPMIDATCLFTCFGGVGDMELSDRVKEQLSKIGITDIDDFTPEKLAALLEFDGALMIEYNGGWNGTSWFAFAPE